MAVFIGLLYLLLPIPGLLLYYGTGSVFWEDWNAWSISPALGILGYSWFAGQFWLAAKPCGLDKKVGLKNLHRIHGTGGLLAGLAICMHFGLKFFAQGNQPSLQTLFGMLALVIFWLAILGALVLMANQFPAPAKALKSFRQWFGAKTGLDYSRLRNMHGITALAGLAMMVHVLMAYSSQQNWAVIVWMVVLAGSGLGMYLRYRIRGRKG